MSLIIVDLKSGFKNKLRGPHRAIPSLAEELQYIKCPDTTLRQLDKNNLPSRSKEFVRR